MSSDEDMTVTTNISSSNINQYEITGLKSSTSYFIMLYLIWNNDMCRNGNGYSTLAETSAGEFNYNSKHHYAA